MFIRRTLIKLMEKIDETENHESCESGWCRFLAQKWSLLIWSRPFKRPLKLDGRSRDPCSEYVMPDEVQKVQVLASYCSVQVLILQKRSA